MPYYVDHVHLTNSVLSQIQIYPSPTLKSQPQMKSQEKQKYCITDYYPPSPIYVASYEEDTPNLVNSLIPQPTLKEHKDKTKQKQKRVRLLKIEET